MSDLEIQFLGPDARTALAAARRAEAAAGRVDLGALDAAVAATAADRVDVDNKTALVDADRVAVAADRADVDTKAAAVAATAARIDLGALDAAVAATDADLAAVNIAAAQVASDKVATHTDRVAADGSAASAIAAAATAAAIAGIVGVYDTKASAQADVATPPLNKYVMVLADETLFSWRTIYKKTATSTLTFAGYLPGPRDIFVSSILSADGTYVGNDANDGLTPQSMKRTLAGARAIATSGCTVWMDGGSIWFGECIDWGGLRGVNFRRYGQGPWPRWTARTSLAGQTWTQPDPTGSPGLWTTRVTPPANPSNPSSIAIYSNVSAVWQPALYDERDNHRQIEQCGIPIYVAGVDRPACIAYVAANPNTYYCAVVGDTHVDPRQSGVTGSQIDYWVNLADSGNPNGTNITHVDQRRIALVGPDSTAKCLTVECTGDKDGMSVNSGALNTTPGTWEDFEFKEAAIHGGVWTGIGFINASFYGAYHGGPIRQNGGGLHNFRATGTQARSRGFQIKNVRIKGFYIAFYSHGAGAYTGSTGEHEFVDIDGALVEDCNLVLSYATENQNRGIKVRNLRAFNVGAQVCDAGAYALGTSFGNSSVTIEDSRIFMSPTAALSIFADVGPDAKITLRRTTIYAPNPTYIMGNASGITDPAHFTTLTMDQAMLIGTFGAAGANRENWNVVLRNGSYLGLLDDSGGVPIAGTITADASSVIELKQSSVDDLRTQYGTSVDPGVITGVVLQVWSKTLAETDFTYVDLSAGARSLSYGGTPASGAAGAAGSTAVLTGSSNIDHTVSGRQIKINLGGTDYLFRVIDQSYGGDNTKLLVTPSPPAAPGAFANLAFKTAILKHKLFAGDMNVTVKVSADGTQIAVPAGLGALFTVGLWVNFPFTNAIGQGVNRVRKLVARPGGGDVFTLSAPIKGANHSPSVPLGGMQNIGGGGGTLNLPTTPMSFGFPFVPATGTRIAKYAVTFVDASLGATGDVTENSGQQVFNTYTGAHTSIYAQNDTTGASTYYTGYAAIDHEQGFIDCGLGLAAGDQITVTIRADIAEQRLAYNLAADPTIAGRVLLKYASPAGDTAGTEYSRRGLGYQARG